MVSTQEYINQKYPQENRKSIAELNISNLDLEGDLDLTDFVNLKELSCWNNRLISLNLSNCWNLEKIYCSSNLLINITLPQNSTNLKELHLSNNNFPVQYLSFLVPYTNLEEIELGNDDEEKIKQGIYNRFTGSLNCLNGMEKLKRLGISNTDLDEVDVDKLPNSLEKTINCSTNDRKSCRLNHIFLKLKGLAENDRCQECQKPNTSKKWCHPCTNQKWEKNFAQLIGKELVDEFISQQPRNNGLDKLKSIPYEQFTNIKYLAEGGFSEIYKAYWSEGKDVVLKSLNNSQNITLELLSEIYNTKLVDGDEGLGKIVECHGISQNPETNNFLIVMEYIKGGNLRQYLKKNIEELNWESKLKILRSIASGLKDIHRQNLVHCDFHAGNILIDLGSDLYNNSYITDLGLCRPANESSNGGKVFGVLPYVAPEILKGKSYNQTSDVYSFGMVAYEVLTGLPPYLGLPHEEDLSRAICLGLRPKFNIKIPRLLKDLIERCWDTDPKQRISINELEITLNCWSIKKDAELTKQIQEVEENNKNLGFNYKIYSQVIYASRLLDFPNLPQPQNNPSQEWQNSTLLDLQIKEVEEEIKLFKEPLEDELKELAENFIQAKKTLIKNENDKEARNKIKKIHQELEKRGLATEDMDKVINYCEKLVNLEQQLEKVQFQAQIEISAKN